MALPVGLDRGGVCAYVSYLIVCPLCLSYGAKGVSNYLALSGVGEGSTPRPVVPDPAGFCFTLKKCGRSSGSTPNQVRWHGYVSLG